MFGFGKVIVTLVFATSICQKKVGKIKGQTDLGKILQRVNMFYINKIHIHILLNDDTHSEKCVIKQFVVRTSYPVFTQT